MTTYPVSLYPTSYDTATFMEVIDGTTSINSALFHKFESAILNIENELGILPSGIWSTVRQRLDMLETHYVNIFAASRSATIATNFNFSWLSPEVSPPPLPFLKNPTPKWSPGPLVLIPTTLGMIPLNLRTEAGYGDGYGVLYFMNEFYVDTDIDEFVLSLWETSVAPIEIISHTFGPGDHTYSVVLPLSYLDEDRIYEIRATQTSIIPVPVNIFSTMWNSRFLFVATANIEGAPIDPQLKYIINTFDYTEANSTTGYKLLGNIPTQAMVQSAVVIIDSAFDGGLGITIGDIINQDSLMAAAENIPTVPGTYNKNSNYEYMLFTPINAYFTLAAAPATTGSGIIIIYYH